MKDNITDGDIRGFRTLQEQLDLLPDVIIATWAELEERYNEFYDSQFEYRNGILTETKKGKTWRYIVPADFMRGGYNRVEFIVRGVKAKKLVDSGRIEFNEVHYSLRDYVRGYELCGI